MNVYDFDKTIYQGDSTLDFYFLCQASPFCNIMPSASDVCRSSVCPEKMQ